MTTSVEAHLSIDWDSGETGRFHWIWLRDSCLCETCRNAFAKQKYFDSATLPLDIRPRTVKRSVESGLEIVWEDGHESRYPDSWLREHSTPVTPGRPEQRWSPWASAEVVADGTFSHADVMADNKALGGALEHLFRYGLVVVRGTDAEHVDPDLLCARLAGFVDRSYFGEYFDLEVKPDSQTDSVSFSTRQLPLHTDIPYYSTPPDYQFLFGLEVNEVATASQGGRTRFVDGLAAAQSLRERDAEAFSVLARTEVIYRAEYGAAEKIYHNQTPIIHLNSDGDVTRLVNNPTKMFFDNVPFDDLPGVYRAYSGFKALMDEEGRAYHHSWRQGDMIVFDNRRILHGREQFDQSGMRRKLRGGYFSEVELRARARFADETV
ncbi:MULTISPECIES: TauD/TfdA family dioxygenase [unclassified Streptomyces]|uniref:TauD/TfdA family dioxygenase n=1 Tax=unclassified Streptomyces TaxID=2593676 RepID=UPI0037B716BA